jgi:hypothetical protein
VPSKTEKTRERISAKEAAERSTEYLAALQDAIINCVIEEAELSDNERYWSITLSYLMMGGFGVRQKQYKVFKVDAYTGEVKSMKIREA